MKEKVYKFLFFVLLINLVIILYSSNPTAPAEFGIKDNLSVSSDWEIWTREDDEIGERIVSFENVISERQCEDPHILICTHVPLSIYVNNKLIKNFSDFNNLEDFYASNFAWRLSRLPSDCYGQKLRLEFKEKDFESYLEEYKTNDDDTSYEVEGIMIGEKQELLKEIIFRNLNYIIFASIILVISCFLFFICYIAKHKYDYFINCQYISFGLICFAIWIFCDCQILMFALNSVTVYYIKYACIFSMPIFMFRHTYLELDITYRKQIGDLCIFQTCCVIIAMLCGIFSVFPLYIITKIMWGIFFINEFLCILFLLPDVDKSTRVQNCFMGHLITYITVFIYAVVFFRCENKLETKYLALGAVSFLVYFLIIGLNKILNTIDNMYMRQMHEMQSEGQIKYYKLIKNNDNVLKKIIHDTKNHWQVIIMLLNENKIDEALSYCNKIISSLEKSDDKTVIRTGNSFFDAVLTVKMQYAKQRNIDVKSNIMVIKDMKIDALDYSILFGNILDNAIEACEKVSDKWISIKIFYKKNMLICKITNSSSAKDIQKYILPRTTKKNKFMHGIGLRNVKDTVEKYKGTFSFKNENGVAESSFVLYIV